MLICVNESTVNFKVQHRVDPLYRCYSCFFSEKMDRPWCSHDIILHIILLLVCSCNFFFQDKRVVGGGGGLVCVFPLWHWNVFTTWGLLHAAIHIHALHRLHLLLNPFLQPCWPRDAATFQCCKCFGKKHHILHKEKWGKYRWQKRLTWKFSC